jgi:hypothetical protein
MCNELVRLKTNSRGDACNQTWQNIIRHTDQKQLGGLNYFIYRDEVGCWKQDSCSIKGALRNCMSGYNRMLSLLECRG